jgi:hypothetical protein
MPSVKKIRTRATEDMELLPPQSHQIELVVWFSQDVILETIKAYHTTSAQGFPPAL